jgi:hypothetical protein
MRNKRPASPDDRAGISVVELLVALALTGAALVPIVSYLSHSYHQIRAEKNEAIAASYAGGLLERILFELTLNQVLNGGPTINAPNPLSCDDLDPIDGCSLKWSTQVMPLTNLRLQFSQLKYHQPHTSVEPPDGIGNGPCDGPPSARHYIRDKFFGGPQGTGKEFVSNWTPAEISPQLGNTPVMADILLTIQWHGPGEEFDTQHQRTLFVRKANLQ